MKNKQISEESLVRHIHSMNMINRVKAKIKKGKELTAYEEMLVKSVKELQNELHSIRS